MYARTTEFQARPENVDDGIAFVRDEVMPALTALDGCIGMSMLVARESGRCIATSAWSDEASMKASDQAVQPMRDRGAEILGGKPNVHPWEIAVLHREHRTADGACARVTWLKLEPSRIEDGVGFFAHQVLPRAEQMDGFCSASMMIDRTAGIGSSTITFDSRAAMEATREQAAKIRDMAREQVGAEITEVAEFELAVAHLRVPETV